MGLGSIVGKVMQATWLTLYKRKMSEGLSPESAILEVLNFLREREPFNALTVGEASHAAEILGQLDDPELFTQVLIAVEGSKDVQHLSDFEHLADFVAFANAKQ